MQRLGLSISKSLNKLKSLHSTTAVSSGSFANPKLNAEKSVKEQASVKTEIARLGLPISKSLDKFKSLYSTTSGTAKPLSSISARQTTYSVSSGSFANLKLTAGFDADFEKSVKEQASVKTNLEIANNQLKKLLEHIRAVEETLQNAFNENAKLKVKQKEDDKLWKGLESKFSSTKTLCDQLTETLQQLASLVQDAEKDKETLENKLPASSEALESLNKQMEGLSLKLNSAQETISTGDNELEKKQFAAEEREKFHSDEKGRALNVIQEKDTMIKNLEDMLTSSRLATENLNSELGELHLQLKVNDEEITHHIATQKNLDKEKSDLQLCNADLAEKLDMSLQVGTRRRALLVGLSYKYESRRFWSILPGINDVLDFKKLLMHHFGYKKKDINMLTDTTKKLSRSELLRGLNTFVDRTKQNEELIFYFSGHGLEDEFHPALFCSTHMGKETGVTGIEICRALSRLPRKSKIYLFIDCCGSGGLFDDSKQQYPLCRWRRRPKLAMLPPNAVAFTATPSGLLSAFAGYDKSWTGFKSFFTESFIQVVRENDRFLENINLVAKLEDRIREVYKRRPKKWLHNHRFSRPALFCSSQEMNRPLFCNEQAPGEFNEQSREVQDWYLGRCEEQKVESLRKLNKEKGVIFEPSEGTNKKKRKNVEEEMEAGKVDPFGVRRMTRECKKNQGMSSSSGANESMKAVNDTKKQQLVVYGKKKRKISIDRWSAERYKLAEESVLKVMKEKEAVYRNPIMRPDLRLEARKYIGDTGLLDHLLKHMAGKVAPGGFERFRRQSRV